MVKKTMAMIINFIILILISEIMAMDNKKDQKPSLDEVLNHANVMRELKEKNIIRQDDNTIGDKENKDEAISKELRNLPYTQSEAHIKNLLGDKAPENKDTLFETFFNNYKNIFNNSKNEIDDHLKSVAEEALKAEQKNNDKIVFYHGCSGEVSFIYDLYSEFTRQLSINDYHHSFRFVQAPFRFLSDVNEFIDEFNIKTPRFEGNYTGNYTQMGLSVNVFLFGNSSVPDSNTWTYFKTASTQAEMNFEDLLKTFSIFGIECNPEAYKKLYSKYYQNNTKLFQIFIHPRVVNSISYISVVRGIMRSFTKEIGNQPLEIIKKIRGNPQLDLKYTVGSEENDGDIRSLPMDELQARIFMKPEIFNNPQYVTIKTYWRNKIDAHNVLKYQKKLKEDTPRVLKQALSFLEQGVVLDKITKFIDKITKMSETSNEDFRPLLRDVLPSIMSSPKKFESLLSLQIMLSNFWINPLRSYINQLDHQIFDTKKLNEILDSHEKKLSGSSF